MARNKSRSARWTEAYEIARKAFDELEIQKQVFHDAMSDLAELVDEYRDWYDNMPEQLQDGPTGEKLCEIIELEFDPDEIQLDDYVEALENAENADLPLGFGRD